MSSPSTPLWTESISSQFGRLASNRKFDNSGHSNKEKTDTGRDKAPTSSPLDAHRQTMANASSEHSGSSSADEDDVPRQPRGGLARKMMASARISDTSSGSEESSAEGAGAETAYERIRKQLLGGPPTNTTKKSPSLAASNGEDSPIKQTRTKNILQRRRISHTHSPASNASRQSSPGLFVSPAKSQAGAGDASHSGMDSDSSLTEDPTRSKKVLERIAKVRAARLEAEREAKARKDAAPDPIVGDDSDHGADAVDIRRRLTQQSRPTRKASKKTLEEMQRETQRMSRNMQLGYQEKTRKRYSTMDLFKKFNYRQSSAAQTNKEDGEVIDQAPGPMASSDVEGGGAGLADTPPTSPPNHVDDLLKESPPVASDFPVMVEDKDEDEDLPDINTLLSQPVIRRDKGKGRAADQSIDYPAGGKPRIFKVKPPQGIRKGLDIDLDSDDESQVNPSKAKGHCRLAVFDRIAPKQAQQSRPLLVQRALAHLTSPSKTVRNKRRGGKSSINPKDVQVQLIRKVREQALQEKQDKIEALRARGVWVPTEEEREQEQLIVENLLEKAREEARLLAKQEKEALLNGVRIENGDVDMPSSDEDEDYVAGGEENEADGNDDGDEEEEVEELDLSGSEDEEEEEEEDDQDAAPNPLFDEEASEDDAEEDDEVIESDDSLTDVASVQVKGSKQAGEESDEELFKRPAPPRPNQRRRQVIEDEDEVQEEMAVDTPLKLTATAELSPADEVAAFAFGKTEESPVSFTQMLKGSMADLNSQEDMDSQTSPRAGSFDPNQDSLAFLRGLPSATMPDFGTLPNTQVGDTQTQAGTDQLQETQRSPRIDLGIAQMQFQQQPFFSPSPFKPTQDGGFEFSQLLPRPSHSTVDTVMVPIPETPIVEKKRGKLRYRMQPVLADSDIEEEDTAVQKAGAHDMPGAPDVVKNAFDAMRKAAKAKDEPAFDKKNSGAKNMVDEQAEESEDEYAGLGGASDDESTGEVDEEVQKMMDDSKIDVDERQIAALLAEQDRVENEKRINQLYQDITTGKLRRGRGGDFELSDDDDDLAEKRRRKQREFSRRTKALLQDENVGKIAENPKKLAFFHALEDRDDEDFDFFDAPPDEVSNLITDSQPTQEAAGANNVAELTMAGALPPQVSSSNPLKRKASTTFDNRRTNPSKRPTNISEVKETLSYLIDEPDSVPDSQLSETDDDDDVEMAPPILRRESSSVVNRLYRGALAEGNGNAGNARRVDGHDNGLNMAFHTSGNAMPTFKMPNLLRRATANLSNASTTSNGGTTTPTGVEAGGGTVKRGGSKKSNIHYQAREAERRKLVEAAEKRKRESVKKKIVGRSAGGSVLGRLAGKGGFE